MTTAYEIQGLHCSACVGRVQKALAAKGIAGTVSLEPPRVTLSGDPPAPIEAVAAAVAAAGDYKLAGPAPAGDGASLVGRMRKALNL